MNVYCYHEPLPGFEHAEDTLSVWRESWSLNGWIPIVLGREHAVQHPKYDEFLAKINTMPTFGRRDFATAAYLRWLAIVVVGGGLLVDYDVVNLSLRPPSRLPDYLAAWEQGPQRECAGTATSGSAENLSRIVDWIMTWNGDDDNISEVEILNRHRKQVSCESAPCVPYFLATPSSLLVHCARGWTNPYGKTSAQAMRALMALVGTQEECHAN
jgi:hypothetical protein